MTHCPKCDSFSISGPYYVSSDGTIDESLRYICRQCGYDRLEQTVEQKQRISKEEDNGPNT